MEHAVFFPDSPARPGRDFAPNVTEFNYGERYLHRDLKNVSYYYAVPRNRLLQLMARNYRR